MNPRRLALLLPLLLGAAGALAQPSKREAHIGYLYPGGGQQDSTFRLTVGGQFLRGVNDIYVSGEGVEATVVKYCRPMRNLQKPQRDLIARRLSEVKAKRLAELPNGSKLNLPRFPGEKFLGKGVKQPAKKTDKDTPEAKPVTLPEHPLLVDFDDKSLGELLHLATTLFNPQLFKKRQQNAQIAESVVIEVTIDRNAAPGNRELRLVTPLGVSNPMCFQVGPLPEVQELEPNDPGVANPLPPEPPLKPPVLINGQIMPGDVDRFRFHAQRGQQLVINTQARRLVPFLADAVPGWFQAVLTLYNAAGEEIAFADDFRFDPDPVLLYRIPESGVYELEIRDSIYRGREDFVYRVSIGTIPFITRMFPLGAQAGSKTFAALDGWNLPRKRVTLNTRPGNRRIRRAALRQRRSVTNEMLYAVDTLPESLETEPNNTMAQAQTIALPQIINGRISRPGDLDVFRFKAQAGDEVIVEVVARRLHSPLDSLVRIMDTTGHVLAWNDDYVEKDGHLHKDMGLLTHHADSYVKATIPEAGTYCVQLGDTRGHGGGAHSYRLRLSPPRPEFTLLISPPNISVSAGRIVPITVHALRRDGFEGPIDVTLKDAPPGFTLSGGRIPRGRNSARMTLAAPPKPPANPLVPLQVQGRASVGGDTIVRAAIPAEDVMQAFLWRHLAPTQELLVSVGKMRWNALSVVLDSTGPVQIPAGGSAQVRFRALRPVNTKNVELVLSEPAKGVSLTNVTARQKAVTFDVSVEGEAAKPGFADNLIVQAYTHVPAKGGKKGAATGKTRRVLAGTLPAIPIEVVAR